MILSLHSGDIKETNYDSIKKKFQFTDILCEIRKFLNKAIAN